MMYFKASLNTQLLVNIDVLYNIPGRHIDDRDVCVKRRSDLKLGELGCECHCVFYLTIYNNNALRFSASEPVVISILHSMYNIHVMYNVLCTINVLRVSSRKIALIFVILIPDDNLRIFCIREFPIRRWEKFLTSLEHLDPCIPSL